MSNFTPYDDTPILVDFQVSPGAYQVSLSPQDIAQKSAEALNQAMSTIHQMAQRVVTTIDALPKKPTQTEVTFGITLNAEVGAIISSAGAEATINVKITFE